MARFGVSQEKLDALLRRMDALGLVEEALEESFIRSGGAGGQKINKTSVAVRLRDPRTGIDVREESDRSQALNRYRARLRLCEKIEEINAGRASARQQKIAKIQRQKRRRSRRAKERMLQDKHQNSEKKGRRRPPPEDG